jgi:hypothetical protein
VRGMRKRTILGLGMLAALGLAVPMKASAADTTFFVSGMGFTGLELEKKAFVSVVVVPGGGSVGVAEFVGELISLSCATFRPLPATSGSPSVGGTLYAYGVSANAPRVLAQGPRLRSGGRCR